MKNCEKFLNKITTIFCCILFLTIGIILLDNVHSKYSVTIINNLNVKLNANNGEVIYLSDLQYETAKVGYGKLLYDKMDNGKKIAVKLNGVKQEFDKGIFAHATSTVVYNISNYNNYDYFLVYPGISANTGNGNSSVKFYVYTSKDGTNWNLVTEENPQVMGVNTNTKILEIPIKEVNYIKLYADSNGPIHNDHAVWADAKLVKKSYFNTEIKKVEEYDELLKEQYKRYGTNVENYELLLLQRNFINNFGYYIVQDFIRESSEHKETFDWLFNNKEVLKLYTVGGKPEGTYKKALEILNNLYQTYKNDLKDETVFTNKFGSIKAKDLYLNMMLALSLSHSQPVYLWVDSSAISNPVNRYKIYKQMHLDGKLVNDVFENLTVEEMRWVVNNIIDDEEILWLNAYMEKTGTLGKGAYSFITYTFNYNYSKDMYYDKTSEKYALWDKKYDLTKYNIQNQKGHPKLWIVFEEGSVCGGIAKTWSNMWGVRGLPSSVVGQPGHAAAITYYIDENGNGKWNLVNDVSGWAQSGRTERIGIRMPNDWGEYDVATYTANLKPDSYVILSQAAQNEYDKYEASEMILLLEDIYKNDYKTLENIYRKALEKEKINFDAWLGLARLYSKDASKTDEDIYKLANDIAEAYLYYPLPMYDLFRIIEPKIKSATYKAQFSILKDRIFKKSASTKDNETLQANVTRTVANAILGLTDNKIATFSFDGDNKETIVLNDRFNDSTVAWDYSLDGGVTWRQTEEHAHKLTKEEIENITSNNDIYIHIIGVDYSSENLYKIDITEQTLPSNLYANDLENRVIGTTNNMEWRILGSSTWTSFEELPNLTGDKTVEVRLKANGTKLTSASTTYTFTSNNEDNTRKYVSISHLSIAGVSSEATAHQGNATYLIDGNYNTRWHSNWNGVDKEKYIIIKLDTPMYISAIDYVPNGGGNGKILEGQILGSMDGENYTEIAHVNWENNETIKTVDFEDSKKVQYIKIVGVKTSSASSLSFISGRMINLYQDLTKNPHPTADINYSTTKLTNKNVTVKLVNPSTNITITNNNGSDTYTFTKNGEFTFEYEDEYGKTGTTTATVNWIDKTKPTAKIEYSTLKPTNDSVVVVLKPSEKVTITNNNGNDTYTFDENGEFTFEYKDTVGNIGTTTATVNWIDKIKPTAKIEYSTTNKTEKPVTATLTEESEPILIINNGGKNIYIFNENGEFIFEFEDAAGNIGKLVAKVNWIEKILNPSIEDKEDDKPNKEEKDKEDTKPSIDVDKKPTTDSNNAIPKPSTSTSTTIKPNTSSTGNTSNSNDDKKDEYKDKENNKVDNSSSNNEEVDKTEYINDSINKDIESDKKGTFETVIFYIVPIITILLISYLITILYRNMKHK